MIEIFTSYKLSRPHSSKMKLAMEILACVFVIVAQATAYVVDRNPDVTLANHYDNTVSSEGTPMIVNLLKSLEVPLSSSEESQEKLKHEESNFEELEDGLNGSKGTTSHRRSARDVGCTEPSADKLRMQLLQAKFFNNPAPENERNTIGNLTYVSTCPNKPGSRPLLNAALNIRASCPWEYKTNESNDRFPKTILYAQCHCRKCIEGKRYNEENRCEPVLEPRYVLKKGACGENNEYQYTVSIVDVPVGCVCSRASES